MPDQRTTTPLHMRVITSPGTRAIVALAVGLIAGAAFAQEQPATPTQQPINEQGISGELFHTLLGLSM